MMLGNFNPFGIKKEGAQFKELYKDLFIISVISKPSKRKIYKLHI